ncbi:MAG TPA: non-homologous end-joining DNA ligase [Chryseosolibacter sp.]
MKSVRSKGKQKLSNYYQPMLATLVDEPFNNPDWVFEIKWDGYRAVAEVTKTNIQLYSRNGLSFKQLFPSIVEALKAIKTPVVLDGEIVVLNEDNKPDFQKLQQYGETKKGVLVFYVFDCVAVNNKLITDLPLLERKQMLQELLPENGIIKYAEHVAEHGLELFTAAKAMDLEGIIAKRSSSLYRPGKRSADWLKIKNHNMQEAVIAGYTEPRGSRSYFGALILGIFENGKLKYIGHTGTGFTQQILKDVYKKMQSLKRPTSPFKTKVPVSSDVTWIEPELVCNIKFSEITQSGILRHPVFMGLRIDKTAKEADHLDVPTASTRSLNARSKSKRTKTLH